MNEFVDYVLQFGNLNPQQIKLVSGKGTEMTLKKDAYFSEAGSIPQQVGFLVKGVICICYYNNKGDEITRHFIEENNLVVDYLNFEGNTASSEYLQAATDCELLVFSRHDWEEISHTIVGMDQITSKILQMCLINKIRKNPVVSQDATTRYLQFLEKFPRLVNRIPLSYIASYLGVTQQSLSRIRKNIR